MIDCIDWFLSSPLPELVQDCLAAWNTLNFNNYYYKCKVASGLDILYLQLVSFRIAAGWRWFPCRRSTRWTRAACSGQRARRRGTQFLSRCQPGKCGRSGAAQTSRSGCSFKIQSLPLLWGTKRRMSPVRTIFFPGVGAHGRSERVAPRARRRPSPRSRSPRCPWRASTPCWAARCAATRWRWTVALRISRIPRSWPLNSPRQGIWFTVGRRRKAGALKAIIAWSSI